MRDLPGLYWDEAKKRYFPLSSKPKTSSQPSHSLQPSSDELDATIGQSASMPSSGRYLKRKRGGVLWNTAERLRGSVYASQNRRCLHEIMCEHIASTSHVTRMLVPSRFAHSSITAFKTSTADGCSFYGDAQGWLYSLNDTTERYECPSEEGVMHGLILGSWIPEINLTSEISSICIFDSRCVATSFGPASKIMVQDLSTSDTFILSPGNSFMHDIWTSHLQGRNLAIGASKKAIFLKDIDTARSLSVLDTQSDVFAIEQQENLIYAGTRNGCVTRFDMRLDEPYGQELLDGQFKTQKNSVTHLNVVREWQLIVGNMDGSLGTYDLRFARGSTPLLTFAGHVNSYTSNLALAVDPSEDFLFVAGQDRRIRAWSLQSGQALQPATLTSPPSTISSTSTHASTTNPLCMEFGKPVIAMQVTNDQEGTHLWTASDYHLFKYRLGWQEI